MDACTWLWSQVKEPLSLHRQTRDSPCAGGACVNQRLARVLRKQEELLNPGARDAKLGSSDMATVRRFDPPPPPALLHNSFRASDDSRLVGCQKFCLFKYDLCGSLWLLIRNRDAAQAVNLRVCKCLFCFHF